MNITSFRIIDSTLREGEQFALAHFTIAQKLAIASALDRFGVDYMELTSPVASPSSEADLRRIAMTERSFRLLTHVRCNLDDARLAIDTGVERSRGRERLISRKAQGSCAAIAAPC